MIVDLKKLIKYENNLVRNEVKIQAGPTNVNIRRMFESQRQIPTQQETEIDDHRKDKQPKTINHQKTTTTNPKDDPRRIFQTHQQEKNVNTTAPKQKTVKLATDHQVKNDKENIQAHDHQPTIKPKGFIRPRSTSQTRTKKSDPVALYQSYQKDWERFKSNMCESSHSDLRWSIREKMMGGSRPT